MTREYLVIGSTHIDLAWKKARAEMTEMLEALAVRLLDALESDPSFKYTLEQAAHYRELAKTRPDLVERLGRYVREGRLEMAGGMASSLETNLPDGECFVRNQAIGRKWVRENWGVEIKTGWLIDTFGIHAQVPQILRQFGLAHLLANRLGGNKRNDVFRARGLDGSEILVAGRDEYSPSVRPENVAWAFCQSWEDIHRLFRGADALTGSGPFLVAPYTENEYLVSLLPARLAKQNAAERPGEVWRQATPSEYFAALEAAGGEWPIFSADLNPEFTGCFSLRPTIRLRNRKIETLLLEAEKWASLVGIDGWQNEAEEAWWRLAFVQFHDVFTGSHPTAVFAEVMEELDQAEQTATRLLTRALETLTPEPQAAKTDDAAAWSALVVNGLPWERREIVSFAMPEGLSGVCGVVDDRGESQPFVTQNGHLRFLASLPSVGGRQFFLEEGDAASSHEPSWEEVHRAVIENEFIRLECDTTQGLRRLIWKPTERVLLEEAGDLLVAQRDDGSFQIEQPSGAEVITETATRRLFRLPASPIEQVLRLTGAFPPLPWAGPENALTWEATFQLVTGKPGLEMTLRLDWKGETSRVRLKLPTTLDTGEGIYEIPFGTVRRKAYGVRGNTRGEWPARRFVALEDDRHGFALANTGTSGVEVLGGTLLTTLLRAPSRTSLGMAADATSSQHGRHEFHFALLPYQGEWAESGVAARAQEINNPPHCLVRQGAKGLGVTGLNKSFLRLGPDNIVLSAVKTPDDGAEREIVVRVYETAGKDTLATLRVPNAAKAWLSDLTERKGEPIACADGEVRLPLNPYEIKTVRICRVGEGWK